VQIVHVLKDGQPVRMSKRAGTYITLRDLIEEKEVGRDAVRFTMLTRKSDAQMEFDIAAAVAQTRDNRCSTSSTRMPAARSVAAGRRRAVRGRKTTDAALAATPLEAGKRRSWRWSGACWLGRAPSRRRPGARATPNRVFPHDLTGDFNMLWNRGNDDAAMRFLQAEPPRGGRWRAWPWWPRRRVIRSGLAVMGVSPVEEMR